MIAAKPPSWGFYRSILTALFYRGIINNNGVSPRQGGINIPGYSAMVAPRSIARGELRGRRVLWNFNGVSYTGSTHALGAC